LAQLGYFKVESSQQQSHRVKKEFPRSDFGHGFRCGHQHLAPRIGEGIKPRRLENVALDGLPLHVVRGAGVLSALGQLLTLHSTSNWSA
jgi:hypothetical protein